MNVRPFDCRLSWLVVVFLLPALPCRAQEQSVKPGINAHYSNPDVEKVVQNFEAESRAVIHDRDAILAACEFRAGMDVADVGAGTGAFTRPIAAKVAPGKVYAVDITPEFLEHIRKTAADAKLDNVTTVLCTPTSVELPEASADFVFLCDTYHHFEFPHKTMASVFRAMRPGARLVLVDYRREESVNGQWVLDHVRCGKEDVIRELTEAGFRYLDEPITMDTQYLIRFEKP